MRTNLWVFIPVLSLYFNLASSGIAQSTASLPADVWYYEGSNHKEQGPVKSTAITELIKNGSIHAHTRIWTNGFADWKAAQTVPQFSEYFEAANPQGTPPPLPLPAGKTNPPHQGGPPTNRSVRVLTPAVGSARRKTVLDAFRIPVEKDLRQKIVFKVVTLRVSEAWAFLRAEPLTEKGRKQIDYSQTRFADEVKEGAFENMVTMLARESNNSWNIVEYDIGATDVIYETWPADHGVPVELIFGEQ